jgi:hypothetical protein
LFPCSQAAKAAAEDAANTADEADAATHKEKVKKTAQSHKNRTQLQSCCSQRAALLACVQGETAEGTEKKAEESVPQDTKICVEFEPCKKTVGCSRLCPVGKRHRGMCKVDGKMVKPDKMQTDMQTDTDDEPKAGADHVLGAARVHVVITPPPRRCLCRVMRSFLLATRVLLLLGLTRASFAEKKLPGADGGQWTVCTHLEKYGLNVEPRYAQALAVLMRASGGRTALEFGCGLGLYSSYLVSSGAATGDVIGIEPDQVFAHLWRKMRVSTDGRPRQAAIDVTTATVEE